VQFVTNRRRPEHLGIGWQGIRFPST
jgi:hypothetical protein